MRFKLEDNTQEAFQFLLLGAVIVLGIRLIIGGIGLWLESGTNDELLHAVSAYRNNYLLRDGTTVVTGGMDIFGRLSMAFLASLLAGVLGSVIAAGVASLSRKPTIAAAVQGARFGLLIMLALATYSALFLAARAVRLTNEGAIFLERKALPGGLSLPMPASEELLPWKAVNYLHQRSRATGLQGCGVHEEVVLQAHGQTVERLLSRTIPTGADCGRSISLAKDNDLRLIRAIENSFITSSQ